MVKNLLSKQKMLRDMGLTPGLGRSPGGGNGNLLQCSCLGNPMGQWSFWWATVHGVTKSWTRLSDFTFFLYTYMGFPGGASAKEPTCQRRRHNRHGFDPWVGKIPWRREWQPTPVFLPGESHGQRRLAGYSPWDRKESDRAEATWHVCMHISTHI